MATQNVDHLVLAIIRGFDKVKATKERRRKFYFEILGELLQYEWDVDSIEHDDEAWYQALKDHGWEIPKDKLRARKRRAAKR